MSWDKVKLGDISTSIQPGPFGSQLHSSDYSTEGTPIIMPKDMIDGHISHSNLAYVSDDHVNRLSRHQVHCGNLMVARKGDVRKCVYITENEEGWMTGSDCLKVALNDEMCVPRYIYYQLRSPFIGKWLETISIGSTMPSINTGLLSSIELYLPPISVQKRVSEILTDYDLIIQNNQKQIKLLEEAAQRLYKEWFIDLRFPGHEDVEIVDGVPEGWKKQILGDLLDVVRGRSYSSKELSDSDGMLMVNLSNIRSFGGYNREQEKHYTGKYTTDQIVKAHDLIMGVTDMTQERRTVGRPALVPDLHAHAMISMDIIKLVPNEGSPLFYYALLMYGGYSEVISRFANGTNVLHLRPDVLGIIDVILPCLEIQMQFVDQFEPIQRKIEALQDESIFAAEARDRLLPKLMSGEIEL